MWYRYQKCIGAPLPWGTGTNLYGIGTTASLHVGTGTNKCGIGTTASIIAPLHHSTTWGFSTADAINRDDLHLFSGHEPLQKGARNSKNMHKHKNARNDQRHLFLHKMRAKHELEVLKSYINVALLCIQHSLFSIIVLDFFMLTLMPIWLLKQMIILQSVHMLFFLVLIQFPRAPKSNAPLLTLPQRQSIICLSPPLLLNYIDSIIFYMSLAFSLCLL